MRNLLPSVLLLPLLAVLPAHAEDQVKPAAATDAAAPASKAKADDEPFTPPPGWRTRQRGKFTVYCQKQAQMGSRVPTEVCYDETGIRAMLAAQAEDREKADQMRRICGSQAACGSN